jgi:hypothetical protein
MAEQQEPVYNAAGTHIHLYNPATNGYWECPAAVAQTFVDARGWVYVTPPDRSLEGLFDDVPAAERPEEGVTAFDPNDHTVGEVNDYLAQYAGSSPGEVARVIELELAGKNRKTVVNPLDDPDGEGEGEDDPDGADPDQHDPNNGQ